MSSKNTTGDKLVASIRKTKTGTATDNSTVTAVAGDTATKKIVAKKPPQRSRKKAVPATAAKTADASNTKSQLINQFQYGKRVWPD